MFMELFALYKNDELYDFGKLEYIEELIYGYIEDFDMNGEEWVKFRIKRIRNIKGR